MLRRYRFGKKSEQLGGEQGLLLEDAVDADIAAIEQALINLGGPQRLEDRLGYRAPSWYCTG